MELQQMSEPIFERMIRELLSEIEISILRLNFDTNQQI